MTMLEAKKKNGFTVPALVQKDADKFNSEIETCEADEAPLKLQRKTTAM